MIRASILHAEQAQTSDIELLHAVARSDEAALAALYDRYRLILFGLLVRILNSREEAEDVLQEVFLQVWRRAGDFDEERGRPFTWLVTLARSRGSIACECWHHASDSRIQRRRKQPEKPRTQSRTRSCRTARNCCARTRHSPDEQRRTLKLAYFEGLTQSEIATQLGTPLGTVKTRMRTGMMKLRELLGEQMRGLLGSELG